MANKTTTIKTTDTKKTSLDNNKKIYANTIPLDKLDMQIITQLIFGSQNKDIAHKMKMPLSTVQRRVRRIMEYGVVKIKVLPDFKRMGFKKGLLHIYVNNTKLKTMAEKINNMEGVLSTSIHVGNSDLVAEFVYEDTDHLVEIFETLKAMPEIKRVLWSEEVFFLDGSGQSVIAALGKRWHLPKNIT